MALLSPGVEIVEIDASAIAPTVSNSTAVFAGNFDKGPVGSYLLISNTDELESYYGKPTNLNYNDWMQASSYLQYANTLFVSRAANTNGTATDSGNVVTLDTAIGATVVNTVNTTGISVGTYVVFGTVEGANVNNVYYVTDVVANTSITLDRPLEAAITVLDNNAIYIFTQSINSVFETVDSTGTVAVTNNYEYVDKQIVIGNYSEFEQLEPSIAFTNVTDSKFKFISRNPGNWGNDIKVAIALPSTFSGPTAYAFEGVSLNDLYEYFPTGTEIAVMISVNDVVVETYLVDTDVNGKDSNNKSSYIENVINSSSSYIYVKDNTGNTNSPKEYIYSTVTGGVETLGTVAQLVMGRDSDIQADDLITAYSVWENKELVDIDSVIANELDGGASAIALTDSRQDCLCFVGANYADVVGKKAAIAINNLVTWRQSGSLNLNNMFVVACANYVYMYDKYSDKNRWVNIAGHAAGLRSATNTKLASWWASAGLDRGAMKQVLKLAFSPTQAQRDLLYKNALNPIVSFPGQGIVFWGQKTLLSKPSSFDRVNVRGLFNTLERSLGKMAKYQVMEFNDSFTRNRIVSMIKPFLGSVKSGRGIDDFLVICDESNNTPDVISRNNLVVDIYIKPTYVAEFIQLRFTNAGTNSFSAVIGG